MGVAFQFPIKWQELPAPRKPRYFWGDERFAADITKWMADGTLGVYEGTGWDQDFTELDFQEEVEVVKAEWANGRWTVIVKRPLKGDYEEVAYLEAGKYIPMVFFAWDGHNGDVGRKMAVSGLLLSGDGATDSAEHVRVSGLDHGRDRDYRRLGVGPPRQPAEGQGPGLRRPRPIGKKDPRKRVDRRPPPFLDSPAGGQHLRLALRPG